ncbi:hypothetical protein [Nocardia testacea]|uniref:Uncharacterized protein n=1 Tax=Nocardia testacea TaxID=248551 RepID=A0ABW7VZV6_9NOCA
MGNGVAVALRDAAELCRRLGAPRAGVRAYEKQMLGMVSGPWQSLRAVAESLRAGG